ncbi:MAG: hypothetical protein IJ523_00380 [Succinivibrionaceae bacterium]|nr:hypothetical protein [Succinivibrionaceae bacterium]
MPFINAKLTVDLSDEQKEKVQSALTDAVGACFGKPKQYVMTTISGSSDLWMGGKKLEKGAFVDISLLGSVSRSASSQATAKICQILESELGIPGSGVYVAYHPVENWGWNGSNF